MHYMTSAQIDEKHILYNISTLQPDSLGYASQTPAVVFGLTI